MYFDRLYNMSTAGKRTALHVESALGELDTDGLLYGELDPTSPVVFRYKKGAGGATPYDFIRTTWQVLRLVSNRVAEVLRPFTGWTTYPVEVYGKKGELISGYHGLAVTGRCGPIDNNRSIPRICEPPVPEGRVCRMWFGLFFDETTWDGSDIFLSASAVHLIFVTEAVKLALEKAKITNVKFTSLTDCWNAEIPAEFL